MHRDFDIQLKIQKNFHWVAIYFVRDNFLSCNLFCTTHGKWSFKAPILMDTICTIVKTERKTGMFGEINKS